MEYKTSDFDYVLPKKFIAQNPVKPRDSSRLLVYDTATDKIYHRHFRDICEYLRPSDVLVVNRSKVIPARILFGGKFGKPEKEIFLLKEISLDVSAEDSSCIFNVLVRPGRYFLEGKMFKIGEDLEGEVLEILEDGTRNVRFWNPMAGGSFSPQISESSVHELLEKYGRAPLPPYIKNTTASFEQYQTVYAKEKGSIAAPTAGLHFTPELLAKIKGLGVSMQEVLLHVGRGTFLPVTAENLVDHKMHSEFYVFSKENADALNKAKSGGSRIIAVGTTSVRVLESIYNNGFAPQSGETDIFIYPGKHKWQTIDALVTNFHLPKSTLIMLVASFLEHKGVNDPVAKILSLYEVAKENDYRFFSFGDAMIIL